MMEKKKFEKKQNPTAYRREDEDKFN